MRSLSRITAAAAERTAFAWLAFWIAYGFLLVWLADRASSPDIPAATRQSAVLGFAAAGIGLYLGNLWLLRRRGGEE